MSQPTAALVTGGRDFSDHQAVNARLSAIGPDVVIHGGASGADLLAAQWARGRGIFEISSPVSPRTWERLGGKAGPARNRLMVAVAVGLKSQGWRVVCVPFPGGRGTASCVLAARGAGLEVLP